jgi:inner membrane protein YidH
MTIRNFSDHAANERTFLAWVRTAIAVMAFGFLVERFDLFLQIAARSVGARALQIPAPALGHLAGLVLIVAGIAMVGVSAVRFTFIARTIDSGEVRGHFDSRFDIALAIMLGLLGCALAIYLLHSVLPALN